MTCIQMCPDPTACLLHLWAYVWPRGWLDLGGIKLDLESRDPLPAKKGDCSEAAAEVWLLSRPHAHAADGGGRGSARQ